MAATAATASILGAGSVPPTGEFCEDLNATLMCPDCKEVPPNLVEEFSSGDMVCGSCGLVLGDRIIDTRSEWRTFSNDEAGDDPSRVGQGPNELIDGDQLQTSIAFDGTGGRAARNLTHAQNKITQDKSTIALLAAYREISSLCDNIHAGKAVADTAKHIFKMVEDGKALKGKSQEAIVAGCIFIACRQLNVPRTFREIFSLTKVSKKEIGRVFKQLETFLGKVNQAQPLKHATDGYTARGSTSAEDLCARYCSNLSFRNSVRIERIAKGLASKTFTVSNLAGRSPLSVAAACIYMASHLMGDPKSTKDIALVAGVSDGTVKTAYRFLLEAKDGLIDPEWLGVGGGNLAKLPIN